MRLTKYQLPMLISGGQTGADRAALDFALSKAIACAGWCPKGRIAEDGVIPEHYPMLEASTAYYPHRTRLNVKDSDATMIFVGANPSKGSLLTIRLCVSLKKPYFVIPILPREPSQAKDEIGINMALRWLHSKSPMILNVAGSRAKENQEIYRFVFNSLDELITKTDKEVKVIWPPPKYETPSFVFS
jgi:predicted Rossmann fold nucleotide-binding protein DprA/Smf involved in DNA uptake